MSDLHEVKVQPPSDKQPVIDINTGCWTKYGQRQQWDLWKRTGGFTDGVWEALFAGLIGSTQFSSLINQIESMQNEIAELRTELAARQSYDDAIEDLRIQIAAAQQFSENIVQQQESARQESEQREEFQVARQDAANGGFEARQWANVQAIADTDQTIANLTTTDVAEGANLYYTDARARLAISATGDIAYNNVTGAISYTAGPAAAGALTGTTLAAGVTISSIEQLGVTYTAIPGVITGSVTIYDSGGAPLKLAVTT